MWTFWCVGEVFIANNGIFQSSKKQKLFYYCSDYNHYFMNLEQFPAIYKLIWTISHEQITQV